MRDSLYALSHLGYTNFKGTLVRRRRGWVLLVDLMHGDDYVSDHVWIKNEGRNFDKSNVKIGDMVCFDAYVGDYIRGIYKSPKVSYTNNITIDYGLRGIRHVVKVKKLKDNGCCVSLNLTS